MQVWDCRDLELTQSLQVPGQVISLDSWKDYVAVGSEVIQLIKLNPKGNPTRTLYANRSDPIKVKIDLRQRYIFSLISSKHRFFLPQRTSDTKHLVAFVGKEGHLATSKAGGSIVNIWPPPPVVESQCDSHVVWKPMFTIDIQGSVTRLLFGVIL